MINRRLSTMIVVASILFLGTLPSLCADITTGTTTIPPDFTLSAGDDFNPDTVNDDAVLNMTGGNLTVGDGTNASVMNIIKTGNVISGGAIEVAASSQLNFYTDVNLGASVSGTGSMSIISGNTVTSSGTIAQSVNTAIDGALAITGGTVSLNTGDTWAGAVNVSGGSLNYDGLTSNGMLTATAGSLNIGSSSAATLNIATGSSIAQDVTTSLASGSTLDISGGTVSLNTGDTWAGAVDVTGGSLNLDNISKTGTLAQSGGTTTVTGTFGLNNASDNISGGNFNIGSGATGGQLTVSAGQIQSGATVDLTSTSTLSLTGGTVNLNTGDTWAGAVDVTGGSLNYDGLTSNGMLTATGGTLNIGSSSAATLNIATGSSIAQDVTTSLASGSTLDISGGDVILDNSDTWAGAVQMSTGSFTLTGRNDATSSTKTYNQTGGNLTLTSTALELNPSSSVTDGNILMNGNSTLTFNNGVSNNKASVTMSNATDSLGVTGGSALELTSSGISGGTLSIGNSSGSTGSSVTLTDGSTVDEAVTFNLYEGNTVNITQTTDPTPVLSTLTLDGTDNWAGDINMTGGRLTLNGVTKATTAASRLTQTGGTTVLDNSNLTLNADSYMQDGYAEITNASNLTFQNGASNKVQLTMTDSASNNLNVLGASSLELNGTSNVAAGTVTVGSTSDTGSTLSLTGGSITSGANINVYKDNTFNVANDAPNATKGNLTLTSSNNLWTNPATAAQGGNINVTGGDLTIEDAQMSIYPGMTGAYTQSAGSTHLSETTGGDVPVAAQTSLSLRDASVLTGGDMILDKNAYLHLDSNDATLDNLNSAGTVRTVSNLMEAEAYGTQTSAPIQTVTVNNDLQVLNNQDGTAGSAKFLVDLNPRSWSVDTYNIGGNVTSQDSSLDGYTVNVDIASLVNPAYAPIDRNIRFNVFNVAGSVADNVTFTASETERLTPIGWYKLNPTDNMGGYSYDLMRYNPEVFRGQVATVASYANQLTVNNLLFDHMNLFNQRYLADSSNNKYAATEPQFSPYQYGTKDGAVWTKLYGNLEHIQMTEHLNVENNAYGALVGFDLPAVSFGDGWNFVPTAYAAYNGAHQSYDLVGMWQNGGQLGLMGTFYKNDFITSLLGYGGVYGNIMNVQDYKDDAFNWFAGGASKTSYNFHWTDSLIFQPNLLISYNLYGRQNWHTGYGEMSMTSGFLNGLNIAPGVNLIWSKETFSLYLMAQYMANIMATSNGKAGNVSLPGVGMTHSFIEYGIGGTKSFGDRFNSYLQISVRNISRTGIVFQGGLSYRL